MLDLGGRAGQVKYPVGYRFALDDGLRNGKKGQEIGKKNDWFALGRLMFDVHQWQHAIHQHDYYKSAALLLLEEKRNGKTLYELRFCRFVRVVVVVHPVFASHRVVQRERTSHTSIR
jgi:hypothetical protein